MTLPRGPILDVTPLEKLVGGDVLEDHVGLEANEHEKYQRDKEAEDCYPKDNRMDIHHIAKHHYHSCLCPLTGGVYVLGVE